MTTGGERESLWADLVARVPVYAHYQSLTTREIPVVVTYHPAYLLRTLPDKAKAWEDLLFARRCLRETLATGSGELPF